jgi:hypothetical protein
MILEVSLEEKESVEKKWIAANQISIGKQYSRRRMRYLLEVT